MPKAGKNLEFQIPITKTILGVSVSSKTSLSIRLPFFKIIKFGILNFDHCVWLVICNFHPLKDAIKQLGYFYRVLINDLTAHHGQHGPAFDIPTIKRRISTE